MMNVWILFNEDIEAPSAEAFEVRRFVAEGREMGINVEVFRPGQFDLLVTEKAKDSILVDGKSMKLPDVLLPRTYVVDTGYFPLAVIRQFERLGVTVYNDSACIEMVADKLHTHQVLVEQNIPTPETMLAKFPVNVDLVEEKIGFPVVVKTLLGVNGTGVFLMEDRKHFKDLMEMIGELSPNIQLIFQKFVSKSRGRDIRLFVVDGEVIAAMERRAGEGDFKANISQGGSGVEIQPDPDAVHIAVKTAKALNIRPTIFQVR
jgi:gamma-F420-2:alpha-L-glutamate ligase